MEIRLSGNQLIHHAVTAVAGTILQLTRSPRADVARATAWRLFTAALVLAGIDYPLWAVRNDPR